MHWAFCLSDLIKKQCDFVIELPETAVLSLFRGPDAPYETTSYVRSQEKKVLKSPTLPDFC